MEAFPFYVVIPARYGSTRLPGKPLLELLGRPMIAHAWDSARRSGAEAVLVATDDERIRAAVEGFGGDALMTSPAHASGTDRLAEVAAARGWDDDAIVVNLQGDEPCIPGSLLRDAARALHQHPEAGIATLATPIREPADVFDENVVKVVFDESGMAGYFSRAPIPWVRGVSGRGAAAAAELPAELDFWRHIGIYAYRVGTLRRLASADSRAIERAESLEQLRALALGIRIHVSALETPPGHGVDTPDDIPRVERALAAMQEQQA
ncbi:3-deoxy-manno-octulosonate cytidylyltransferase [Haliangium ochraceum]|uniref:3-deoxy-manno-octulosonate cytidylyltransferase n=1 Tax=Haliangium ochraceum (strain DSM 14365 / JCM 11303 / SMP-2) TaxID=502025 RepID=D0LJR7_HALO1|nr:3-deoxy-manno-octulosonate cytidylyltransferase [Haliangium ochraceum]ACY18424.1 3-deoxy-D-manno-octulosonatecytidylyltransferase [Haliangium ochraceum DSM 14365]